MVELEEVFSSRGRVRVLRLLSEMRELKITHICERAKMSYVYASKHLLFLEKHDIVCHKTFGRVRLFRLNKNNIKALKIRDLMDHWEKTKQPSKQ